VEIIIENCKLKNMKLVIIKQSIKLFTFTAEAQRSQRKELFVCREVPTNKTLFDPLGDSEWPKA